MEMMPATFGGVQGVGYMERRPSGGPLKSTRGVFQPEDGNEDALHDFFNDQEKRKFKGIFYEGGFPPRFGACEAYIKNLAAGRGEAQLTGGKPEFHG